MVAGYIVPPLVTVLRPRAKSRPTSSSTDSIRRGALERKKKKRKKRENSARIRLAAHLSNSIVLLHIYVQSILGDSIKFIQLHWR